MIAAVKTVRGVYPMSMVGDSSDPKRLALRSTDQEAKHVLRSRILNPNSSSIKIDFNGKPEFVCDIACFPGSSGSPVVLFRSLYPSVVHVPFVAVVPLVVVQFVAVVLFAAVVFSTLMST